MNKINLLAIDLSDQRHRKHLKLGGTTLEGHLFPEEKGAFSKNKKGTSLFIAKSWGQVPAVPPGSYVYDLNLLSIYHVCMIILLLFLCHVRSKQCKYSLA